MRFAATATVVVTFAAFWFGCSSSSESSTPTATPEEQCASYAESFCNKAQGCAGIYVQLGYGDLATCKTRFQEACKRTVTAPNTGFTAAFLTKCVASVPGLDCQALFEGGQTAECVPPPGLIDDGKGCGDDSQCKTGFCAIDESVVTCGTCGPKPAEGAACVGNDCPVGLHCNDGKCVKPSGVGATCDAGHPCGAFLDCASGKCAAQAQNLGDACDDKGGLSCDVRKGIVCIGKKCEKLLLVGEGKECGLHMAGLKVSDITLCEKSGFCDGLDIAKAKLLGTCKPAAKDGEACKTTAGDLASGPNCLPTAVCIAGVCRVRDPASCTK